MITQTKTTWRKVKLGEVASTVTDFVANGSFASLREYVKYYREPEYAVLVRTKDLQEGFSNELVYVDKNAYEFLSKSKLLGGEIILSNVGNVGAVFQCPKLDRPMTLGPNAIILKTKEDDCFYYYYFKSPIGQHKIDSLISGSSQPKFNKTHFRALEIEVPEVATQKRIADVLSAFDDKIELNNKISVALEQMAQAIFKEWFVKKSKFKNQNAKLGTLADISYGRGPSSSQLKKSGHPVYGANGIIGYFDTYDFLDRQIIIGCRGVVGNVTLTLPKCTITHNSLIIAPKNKRKIFFYYLLLNQNLDVVVGGSAQPQITINDLEKLDLLLPEEMLQDKFESVVENIEQKRLMLFYENQKLAALRDLLLPKLMSGEVKVK